MKIKALANTLNVCRTILAFFGRLSHLYTGHYTCRYDTTIFNIYHTLTAFRTPHSFACSPNSLDPDLPRLNVGSDRGSTCPSLMVFLKNMKMLSLKNIGMKNLFSIQRVTTLPNIYLRKNELIYIKLARRAQSVVSINLIWVYRLCTN